MKIFNFILVVFLCLVFFSLAHSLQPSGVTGLEEERSERATPNEALSAEALAGNVTELNIYGYSTTRAWQGYFGNVSGTIQLAYGSEPGTNEYVFYNWSVVSPAGEVYASTNSSIQWENIQCFNFSATGTYEEEIGNGGETNLHGTNLSILESEFGIWPGKADSVNETFHLIGPGTHSSFFTAGKSFSEGQCPNTRIFGANGQGNPGEFEQVLLYEPFSRSVVFSALLEEGGTLGFDGNTYDFQMLVLEDGHGTNVESTTYYFFVELE